MKSCWRFGGADARSVCSNQRKIDHRDSIQDAVSCVRCYDSRVVAHRYCPKDCQNDNVMISECLNVRFVVTGIPLLLAPLEDGQPNVWNKDW